MSADRAGACVKLPVCNALETCEGVAVVTLLGILNNKQTYLAFKMAIKRLTEALFRLYHPFLIFDGFLSQLLQNANYLLLISCKAKGLNHT